MSGGIEKTHSRQPIGQQTRTGDEKIQPRDRACDLCRARQNLFRCVGAFQTEQLHAADIEHGQNRDGHDDNADAAKPLQQGAPKQNAGRSLIQLGNYGGTGCCQAGHGLEKRIRITQP